MWYSLNGLSASAGETESAPVTGQGESGKKEDEVSDMENKYDVIIIGAGPGGIFCAYELMRQRKGLKVLLVEKGRSIEKRSCPKRTTMCGL